MASHKKPTRSNLYARIQRILESARTGLVRTVNTTQVVTNWMIGREIVEEEQKGQLRAAYGSMLLDDLSKRLTGDFGRGYSRDNLEAFRSFYLGYPLLISDAGRRKLRGKAKSETPSRKLTAAALSLPNQMGQTRRDPSGVSPGLLHPNLSWSLYRQLLKPDHLEARSF